MNESKGKHPIVAVIQARGGSKGVPGKNIKNLLGFPVLAWSIAVCKLSKRIDRVILTTDSQEIALVGKQYGAEVPFIRPNALATDSAKDYGVIKHSLSWLRENEKIEPMYIVQIRPTTPLRDPLDIDLAIKCIESKPESSGLRSVFEMPETAWKTFEINKNGFLSSLLERSDLKNKLNSDSPRQLFPSTYLGQGLVDIIRPKTIDAGEDLYGERVIAYISDDVGEIDTESDFEMLEYKFNKFGYGKKIYEYLSKL